MTAKNCEKESITLARLDERMRQIQIAIQKFENYPDRIGRLEYNVSGLQANDELQNRKLEQMDNHIENVKVSIGNRLGKIEEKAIFIDGKKSVWIGVAAVILYPIVNAIIANILNRTIF